MSRSLQVLALVLLLSLPVFHLPSPAHGLEVGEDMSLADSDASFMGEGADGTRC